MPNMGGMGQNMGGFGNQGSTGFGGASQNAGGFTPAGFGGAGWEVTRGNGFGGGNPTTPNNPPSINQPPTMNTPTGGLPPTGGSFPPPPRIPSPTQNPGQDTRYPPGAGVHNFAQTDAYQNSMGQGGPQSPMTPNIGNPYQPSTTGGGGGQTVPRWGTTVRPTYNYGGNTSTYNMTQQGDTLNQGQSMKRLQNRRRAQAAKAPRQQDRRGSTVQQNLNAMSGGMRYM